LVSKKVKPIVGLVMGDPAGIGPEITVKSILRPEVEALCTPVILGDARVVRLALEGEKINAPVHVVEKISSIQEGSNAVRVMDTKNVDPGRIRTGQASSLGGHAVWGDLSLAGRMALDQEIDGIVAGPHNKYSVNLAGIPFAGYPPFMAQQTGSPHAFNMLIAGPIRVVGVTLHLPLKEVSGSLTPERILATIEAAHGAVKRIGIKNPRIAVTGLNPHCGEEGLFGTEEKTAIHPAISAARGKGIAAYGPFPADSLFAGIQDKQDYDVYVAMYHDQSHIAIKTVAFDRIVGLIIGTSLVMATVGHGSAFDIAGKGLANPEPMMEAIRLVARSALFNR
jgi:4-hydroxythreonine-4-phosphate dehydrogenase